MSTLTKSVLNANNETASFFNKETLLFVRTERVIEQGAWISRRVPVMRAQKAGYVHMGIEVNESTGYENHIWVTETLTKGLVKAYRPGEEGEPGDTVGELSPNLIIMKNAIDAFNNEDYELYNMIIIKMGVRGALRNYMFSNSNIAPTEENKSVTYYKNKFGEYDRFTNMAKAHAKAHADALYPAIKKEKGYILPSDYLFNADYLRDDRVKADYDAAENVFEDPTSLPKWSLFKRQETGKKQIQQTTYKKKLYAGRIKSIVSPVEVEILSAWSLQLAPVDEMTDEYLQFLDDNSMIFEKETKINKVIESVLDVFPVVLMGGEASYYTKEQWAAMQPFRSLSCEEEQERAYLNHENGEEKHEADIADPTAILINKEDAFEHLKTLSLKRLQNLCRNNELDTSGDKGELQRRIVANV